MASADEILKMQQTVERLKQELAGVEGELKQVYSRADKGADIPKLWAEFKELEKKRDTLLEKFWLTHAYIFGPARET